MITKELIEYIKTCRKQNIPDEQIKSALKEQGWADKDINTGFSQIPQFTEPIQSVESIKTQKPKKKFLIPLIIIIAAIVFGGAVWAGYNYWFKDNAPEERLEQKQEQEQQSIAEKEKETAEWKTYKNEDYGFELKYPGDWNYTILEMSTSPIMFAPEDTIGAVKESFQNIKSDKSLTLWATLYDKNLFERGILPNRGKSNEYIKRSSSDVEVDGIKGSQYISEYIKDKGGYIAGDKTVTVDLAVNNFYLTLDLFDYQYIDIFKQIISTFKVIK
jgi:hypothetical protein